MVTKVIDQAEGFVEETLTERLKGFDAAADVIQKPVKRALGTVGPVKDLLHGIWLRHPLHPVLSDIPIGAWCTGLVMDILGWRRAGDDALKLGVIAAVPTALSGMADWSETGGRQRRAGLIHGLTNVVGLGLMIASWVARGRGHRSLGVGLSATGLAFASAGAWLGGDLVYGMGTGVSRNAFEPEPSDDYVVAARLEDLSDGRLAKGEAEIDGQKVALVLLRRGGDVLALSNVCSHLAGPLNEGSLHDGDVVECPWHGSRFSMRDGSVCRGPAAVPAPTFQTRIRGGMVEVRRLA